MYHFFSIFIHNGIIIIIFHTRRQWGMNVCLPALPRLCVDEIFSSLPNKDFRNLIKVCGDPYNDFKLDLCDCRLLKILVDALKILKRLYFASLFNLFSFTTTIIFLP